MLSLANITGRMRSSSSDALFTKLRLMPSTTLVKGKPRRRSSSPRTRSAGTASDQCSVALSPAPSCVADARL
eukprot:6178385-Pleurochrysis_carterae.AAC.3